MTQSLQQLEIEELLYKCRGSTKATAQYLFPEHFTRPFDDQHNRLFNVLDEASYDEEVYKERGLKQSKTVIAAPRGIGKTTITGVPYAGRHALFGLARYIVFVGASIASAIEQTETLKQELTDNPIIHEIFGDIRAEMFAQDRWDIKVGVHPITGKYHHRCRILPMGPGGKVRGRKHGRFRPDLIIIDDLENDENVDSEDQRKKQEDWLYAAVLNSIDRSKDFKVVMVGTILHENSVLSRLLGEYKGEGSSKTQVFMNGVSGWDKLLLRICDIDYNTLWPNYISTKQIANIIQEHRDRDAMSQFAREYMNQAVADEDRVFKSSMFRYYTDDIAELNNDRSVINIVSLDPARSHEKGCCRTAISVVGISLPTRSWYIRWIVCEHLRVDEIYDTAVTLIRRYNCKAAALEVTGLKEHLTGPWYNRLYVEGFAGLLTIEVSPRDKKERRANGLLPYYRNGYIHHNSNSPNIDKYEDYLQQWPRPAAWDEIDTISQIVAALEKEQAYFAPPEYDDNDETVYKALLKEDEMQEDINDMWIRL